MHGLLAGGTADNWNRGNRRRGHCDPSQHTHYPCLIRKRGGAQPTTIQALRRTFHEGQRRWLNSSIFQSALLVKGRTVSCNPRHRRGGPKHLFLGQGNAEAVLQGPRQGVHLEAIHAQGRQAAQPTKLVEQGRGQGRAGMGEEVQNTRTMHTQAQPNTPSTACSRCTCPCGHPPGITIYSGLALLQHTRYLKHQLSSKHLTGRVLGNRPRPRRDGT